MKSEIIQEVEKYELFLQGILDEYGDLNAGGTIIDMANAFQKFSQFTEDYNRRATERLNELLVDERILVDKHSLKEELLGMAIEYYHKYKGQNFHVS